MLNAGLFGALRFVIFVNSPLNNCLNYTPLLKDKDSLLGNQFGFRLLFLCILRLCRKECCVSTLQQNWPESFDKNPLIPGQCTCPYHSFTYGNFLYPITKMPHISPSILYATYLATVHWCMLGIYCLLQLCITILDMSCIWRLEYSALSTKFKVVFVRNLRVLTTKQFGWSIRG